MRAGMLRGVIALAAAGAVCATVLVPARRARPSIVIVLVDQMRADAAAAHLRRVTRLASTGVIASNMRSAAPWTYPSVISLMTGLYPQQHGAGGRVDEPVLSTFDPALPLLPKLLRSSGYRTAAFVANPFFHDFNPFHESFDHFDISFIGYQGSRLGTGEGVWTERMFGNSVESAVREYFRATPSVGPEFTYGHFMDVHGPWQGAPFLSAPGPPGKKAPVEEAVYAAAVEYVDERIGELYDLFLRRYDGKLIFIVTSDHGRALDDDEKLGDGRPLRRSKLSLFDFNLRIPFFILPSKVVDGPHVIEGPCSNIDVVPTLLDWVGLTVPRPLPGRSMLPAIRVGALDADRALFATTSWDGHRSDAVVSHDIKLIRWFDPQTGAPRERRVFALAQDPRELSPVVPEPPGLSQQLAVVSGDHGVRYRAEFRALDPDQLERLRAVGYLR